MTCKDNIIDEMKTAYDEKCVPYMVEATGSEAIHIIELLQAEAENRLVKLPCAVGDTVYWVTKSCDENGKEKSAIHEGTIISFSLQNDGLWFYCRYRYGLTFGHKIEYFGKTVFLSREEAEKTLERSSNEKV